MAQERRQPLPIGRYWLDLRPGVLDTFRAWAASNPLRITVERFEAHGGVTFAIFRVLQPTRFDQRTFGFPSIAPADIQQASDTAQRPAVPTPLGTLNDILDRLHLPSLDGMGAIVALAAAYLLMREHR